jgi:hypothetical protein
VVLRFGNVLRLFASRPFWGQNLVNILKDLDKVLVFFIGGLGGLVDCALLPMKHARISIKNKERQNLETTYEEK